MSSYRDDLEAAHARIRALEAQVGGAAEGESLGPLFERLAAVEARVGEVARAAPQVADFEQQLAALEARLTELGEQHAALLASVRARPATEAPTVVEHNRERDRLTAAGGLAGITCPLCLLVAGERVEMYVGNPLGMNISSGGARITSCPRCGYTHMKRA